MGVDTKEEKTILKVEELRDIRYEASDNFSQSISKEAYKRATKIAREIIKDNEIWKSWKTNGKSGTDKRNKEQIYNIIFFTGNRGSGKTSAMLSYMEYLKDYYRSMGKKPLIREDYGFGEKSYMFTGIEYIDASSLDEKEDILGSVLAKMLKKWQDEEARSNYGGGGIVRNSDYAYNKRQISMLFSRVYELLKNLRSSDDPTKDDSDAFMETLQNLSLTRNLQGAFQDLVEKYLAIMEYPGTEENIKRMEHFLVISIDDLDMNIENGFRLLEEIRRYFMIPNIIVLLSANYDQLEKICLNHYMTKFDKIRGVYNTNQYIVSLAREYLEKIIPARRQIVMESGRKWRFFNQKKISIQYKDPSTGIEDSIDGTLEEIVKEKMYETLGAQFIQGEKCLAYLTPDTVRELCAWINHTARSKKEETIKSDEEYRWFENEEFASLCRKYLEPQDRDVFEVLESLDPQAQMAYVTEYLRIEYKIDKEWSLLEALAKLRKEGLREQSFASLLNIYFTVKLSKLHEYMENEEEDEDCSKIEFLKYFKEGVWGQWEKRMVGPFQRMKNNAADGALCELSFYSFDKIGEALNIETKFPDRMEGKKESNVKKTMALNRSKEILENEGIKGRLKNYQCLLLFYDFFEENDDVSYDTWSIVDGKFVINENYRGRFCLSNPFINLVKENCLARNFLEEFGKILYEQELKKVEGVSGKIKYTDDDILNIKELQETISEKISIFSGDEMIVPLDNLDFLIILGEKLESTMGSYITVESNIVDRISEYYKLIENTLQKMDQKQAEDFSAQEFVRRIKKPNKELREMLTFSIMASTKSRTLMTKGTEWGN